MTMLVLIAQLLVSQGATAKVVQVIGHVDLIDARGNMPLDRFSEVPVGATVQTFADGRASLRLPSGTLVRLGNDTRVELAGLTRGDPAAERKESLKVSVGRLWARVTHLFGADSKFEVATENAVAGVRGTEFFVQAQPGHEQFAVDQGTIVVTGGGASVTLDGAGATAVLESGLLTTPPKLSSEALAGLRNDIGGAGASLLHTLDPTLPLNHEPFRWVLVGPYDPADDILPASRAIDSLGGAANVTVRLHAPGL